MSSTPEGAPENCPGAASDSAGKASACAGCPSRNMCATATRGPDPDLVLIHERLTHVKHKILVLSGKGGVGKSTVSTQLAWALANAGKQVGLLDIDMCGPSIPRMMGVEGEPVHMSSVGWTPVWVDDNLCLMSIGFLLPDKDDAVIWRGPKKNGLIKQFLKDVVWGELDYLIIDWEPATHLPARLLESGSRSKNPIPPGTSDEHISIAQFLGMDQTDDGVVLVTTPQEVALLDVRKEVTFCRRVNLPVLGVVENMAGFVCGNCSCVTEIFPPNTGGAAALCTQMDVNLLGQVPLDPRLARACDDGKSFFDTDPESPATDALRGIVKKIEEMLAGLD